MPQSLSRLYIHIIFHIKSTSVLLRKSEIKELYAYIGGLIKSCDSIPIIINGTQDHIHILCIMSKNIALATLVEKVKQHSSRWIKTKDYYYNTFAWQGGYAGFSVSQSIHSQTKSYIENQEEHHKKTTFQEEYLMFLKKYNIEFQEEYLWRD